MPIKQLSHALPLDLILQSEQPVTDINQLSSAQMLLEDLSIVSIVGADATSFLQGQFTNDLSLLDVGQIQLNAYCNPKGRALAVFYLRREEDRFQIILPADTADTLVKRLQLYKMRAKVEIVVCVDTRLIGTINCPVNSLSHEFANWQIDSNRQVFAVDNDEVGRCVEEIGHPLVDYQLWRLGQILGGFPQVYHATYEEFIPQHINLDLVDAVSFTKGCYPGQEIVARIRYLGKIKKRMISGWTLGENEILPGAIVYTDKGSGQKVGMVVDTVQAGKLRYTSMIVSSNYLEQGDLMLGAKDGPTIQRLQLPYSINTEH